MNPCCPNTLIQPPKCLNYGKLELETYAMIRGLADVFTGRDSLALNDTDPYEWAESILARYENREPMEADD